MKKKLGIIAAAVLAVFLTSPAQASKGGNELHKACQADRPDPEAAAFERGFCMGYISGVTEALGPPFFCPPEGAVTRNQYRDIVKNYLNQHPERRHKHSTVVILEALSEAFPCKESK